MPKTKGAMDNCLETLEKNVESLRKAMEEREASANKSMEFLWKKMEDREERMNQQVEDIRSMLTSFMSRQTYDQEEISDGRLGNVGSGGQHNHQEEKSERVGG